MFFIPKFIYFSFLSGKFSIILKILLTFAMKSRYYLQVIAIFILISSNLMAQEEDVFKIVEEMPSYGDCISQENTSEKKSCSDKAIYDFLAEHISYPETAQEKGTEGTVVVRFVVNKKGQIKDAVIVKDVADGCGEEALRVLNMMGKWKPGEQKGKKVSVQMHLPIKFKYHKLIVQTEKFLTLNDLFCADYLTDFIGEDIIHAMATDELVKENVCSVSKMKNRLGKIKLTLTKDAEVLQLEESEDGNFTEAMRSMLKKVKSGDVIELDYEFIVDINGKDLPQIVYKSVIVE